MCCEVKCPIEKEDLTELRYIRVFDSCTLYKRFMREGALFRETVIEDDPITQRCRFNIA